MNSGAVTAREYCCKDKDFVVRGIQMDALTFFMEQMNKQCSGASEKVTFGSDKFIIYYGISAKLVLECYRLSVCVCKNNL